MKFRKNQKVTFTTIDEFTGETLKLEGVILDEGYHYISTHQDLEEERGEILEDEAYVIKVKENSHSEKLHLVLLEDILEIKK
ncbi:hypothetical protein ES702_07801 [subsurface metagenome]